MFRALKWPCASGHRKILPRSSIVPFEFCLFLLCFSPTTATAGSGTINEVKVGALAHDIATGSQREHGIDINGEILFQPVDILSTNSGAEWLSWILDPRPVIGLSVNSSGYTDQLYIGANWHADLASVIAVSPGTPYIEFTFGGAVHDGRLSDTSRRYAALGSRLLFHLSTEIGIEFGSRYTLGLYFEHASNGGMARFNRSLNDAGVRLGYRL